MRREEPGLARTTEAPIEGVSDKQAEMRKAIIDQMVFFLRSAGHPKDAIKDEVMAALERGDDRPSLTPPALPERLQALGDMIWRWGHLPEYTDDEGNSLLLPLVATKRGEASFQKLVLGVDETLDYREIAQALVEYETAALVGDTHIALKRAYVRLNKHDQASAAYRVKMLADLLHTMTHNLGQAGPGRMFQRSSWTSHLNPDYLPQLLHQVEKRGEALLSFINARMDEHDVRKSGMGSVHLGEDVTVSVFVSRASVKTERRRAPRGVGRRGGNR